MVYSMIGGTTAVLLGLPHMREVIGTDRIAVAFKYALIGATIGTVAGLISRELLAKRWLQLIPNRR